jgi:hypothetical protein
MIMAFNNANNAKESAEEQEKQSGVNNKQKFINDFCSNKISDSGNKNKFLDEIFSAKDIS